MIMEKEFNKEEYTRMCVEVLGFVSTTPTDNKDFKVHEHPITGEMLDTNFDERFIRDWNWIMEVVNKALDIEDDTYGALRIYSLLSLALSKADKELVVQAIWEFLLWYNKNKKEL
jgi:hypothetical protein